MASTDQSRAAVPTPTSVGAAFCIRQVQPADSKGIELTTELHMELLSFGPMAQFGDKVIRETIYAPAVAANLLEVAIAEVDGRAAGFIAYTTKPHDFHTKLLQQSFLKAAWVLSLSLLTHPGRMRHLPRAFQVIFSRNALPNTVAEANTEVVCFGVRPEYLTPAFVRQTGLRVGVLLLEHAFDSFRQNGFHDTRMIVDADNPRALLFYQSLGAELTPCTFSGVPSYVVHFTF